MKKISIYLVFITQFHFAVPKNIRLKIQNKRELQQKNTATAKSYFF